MKLNNQICCGDSRKLIKQIPDHSVQLTITSPAYFQQRDYLNSDLEMGQEKSIEEYIANLVSFFKECVRVTKKDGSIIFNLGDKYLDGNLLLIPYRFAIAVQDCGVKLINNITWAKSNPTPRQFKRRMVTATEPFFHFVHRDSKDYKYYYERLACSGKENKPSPNTKIGQSYYNLIDKSNLTDMQKALAYRDLETAIQKVESGEIRSFRMKIAGIHAPAFGGQPGGRTNELKNNGYTIIEFIGNNLVKDWFLSPVASIRGIKHLAVYPQSIVEHFITLTTDEGDLVFDPFIGSGTSALAAQKLGRFYLGFELSENYAKITEDRLKNITPPEAFDGVSSGE